MLPRRVEVPLEIISLPEFPADLVEVRCIECDSILQWHQPDLGAPDRILGICPDCGRWYLLDLNHDEPHALLVLLPSPDQLRFA